MAQKKSDKEKGFSTIRIKDATKAKLAALGKKDDSYEDIISKLLKK